MSKPYFPVSLFFREVLKIEPYPWQMEALKCVALGKESLLGKSVALVAPNGSGKTACCVAPAILYFLSLYPRGQVPVTSSSWMQVEKQIFPALKSYLSLPAFAGWECTKTELRTPQGGFAIGFSTDNAGRAEGWHPKHGMDVDPVLYVLDEAKSIPDGIFSAVSRCTLHQAFITSSPGADNGAFYQCFHRNAPSYYKIRVTYDDCPHIEKNDRGRKARMLAEYGEHSPIYRSSILGEFTDVEGQGVVKRHALEELLANPPEYKNNGEICAGFDFAGGRDENVVAIGQGNRFFIADHWASPDTVTARGRFRYACQQWGVPANAVFADGDGLGLPMVDDFRAEGFFLNVYRGGFPADDSKAFANVRAQAWHAFSRAIETKQLILDIDEITKEQILAPRLEVDTMGRIKIESKDDMAKRGVRSPDRADALVMAWHARKNCVVAQQLGGFYRKRQKPSKNIGRY